MTADHWYLHRSWHEVLIKRKTLERIQSGEITLAFRRWRRPTVKTGSILRTAIGELSIRRIQKTSVRGISEREAYRAGYESKVDLLAALRPGHGDCYRIELAYAGVDRRIALRQDDALDETELAEVRKRLSRMDARSPVGPWTRRVLAAIQAHPKRVSSELAEVLGIDRVSLKSNVRILKDLGLTISHERGYTLSRRGQHVLTQLTRASN